MATEAGIFTVGVDVAHLAFLLSLVAMIYRERMPIQLRWIPAGCYMAIFTLESKESHVYFRLYVTGATLVRGFFVNISIMTVLAIEFDVTAIQWEEICMIKSIHSVDPIMAFEAKLPELG